MSGSLKKGGHSYSLQACQDGAQCRRGQGPKLRRSNGDLHCVIIMVVVGGQIYT